MVYEKISGKLGELQGLKAVGFPDGSIDKYCRVEKGKERYMDSKEEFRQRIQENESSSFRMEPKRKEPGGKSVNMSIQAHSLGLETEHYGFLDDPIFNDLEFDNFSMGSPAEVTVCEFNEGSVLFAVENEKLVGWSFEEMEDVAELPEALNADVVCCANWISLHHMNEELKDLLEMDFEASVFNFDPGSLTDVRPGIIKDMFKTLGKLSRDYEVLVHANTDEVEAVAEIYGVEGSVEEKIEKIREKTGVSAYILHDKYRAIAGTDEGLFKVENLVTDRVETRTGAGDRFDAAVAAGRAADWAWEESLALGNICAVHYIENSETARPKDVKAQIDEKI